MESDDNPVGLILSRREALKVLGVGSAAFLAACASPEGTSTLVPTDAATQDYQFTSQFFFDDALTDQIHALEPYVSKGQRDTRNPTDNIFIGGGEQLLLNLQGDSTSGYTGTMNIGLDLTDIEVGASDSAGPGGPPP
jgi:hypothetical protein